jgi:hypothetical protein
VLLSGDISPQWQIETDLSKTSEFEVRFVAETPLRTRVELEHRHLDRHGEGWQSERDAVAGDQGWPLYLERFAALVAVHGQTEQGLLANGCELTESDGQAKTQRMGAAR